jgi:type I restriction enzyme S subunit
MNRYEEYQETGFEWLGKIPSNWGLSRVGKFFTERSEKVDDVTYPPLSVTMSGIVDQLSDVAKTNDGGNRKLVKKT